MNIFYKKINLVSLCTFLLMGCSPDNHDLKRYLQEIEQQKSRPVPPMPEFTLLPLFQFQTEKRLRNPFESINFEGGANQKRSKEPLENYPLNELKFVGTFMQEQQIWALIREPNSHIARVQVGNYLGQKEGRIILISKNFMQLEETISNNLGIRTKHSITIALYNGN